MIAIAVVIAVTVAVAMIAIAVVIAITVVVAVMLTVVLSVTVAPTPTFTFTFTFTLTLTFAVVVVVTVVIVIVAAVAAVAAVTRAATGIARVMVTLTFGVGRVANRLTWCFRAGRRGKLAELRKVANTLTTLNRRLQFVRAHRRTEDKSPWRRIPVVPLGRLAGCGINGCGKRQKTRTHQGCAFPCEASKFLSFDVFQGTNLR